MTDDREFDRILEEGLSDLPLPEGEAEEITPWKRAIVRITWGIGLTTIHLSFWYLNYLLPAIGMVLLWLGFRTLRRESKWFAAGWLISVYQVFSMFTSLVSNATLWRSPEEIPWWIWLTLAIPLTQLICLWQGIRAVRRKAGQPDEARAAGALVVWHGVLCVLAIIGVEGWLLILPMLVAYVRILRNLFKLSNLLDGAGYQVQAAPVWVSDRTAWVTYFLALVAAIWGAALLFGRYQMEWTPVETDEQAGLEDIRAQLLKMDFPVYVLDDLSVEDLADCAGAIRVEADWEEESMNGRRKAAQNTKCFTEVGTMHHDCTLELTNVAVALPDNRWKVFHYFRWQEPPKVRGTESIQLCVDGVTPESYFVSEDQYSLHLSGRLLCDRDGTACQSDYYSLERENEYTYDFFGNNPGRDIYAEFSLPMDGEHCRGYVSYTAQRQDKDWICFWSQMNYTHQISWLNYPAITAKEYRMTHLFGNSVFDTVQTDLQACLDLPDTTP